MSIMYVGNLPDENKGWSIIAKWQDENKTDWFVFVQPQEKSKEWVNIKVAANGKINSKANYWFCKHKPTGKIGYIRDLAMMRKTKPELHQFVESALKGIE